MADDDAKGRDVTSEMTEFIDYFGTHIVSQMKLGAKYQYNFTMTSEAWSEIETNSKLSAPQFAGY